MVDFIDCSMEELEALYGIFTVSDSDLIEKYNNDCDGNY